MNGKNIAEMTVAQLAKHIGMVFQNPNDQIFKKTVLDEVMFGPINIGMSKAEAKKKAEKALALVGMEDKISVNPYDLGLSERKLISIAAIVASLSVSILPNTACSASVSFGGIFPISIFTPLFYKLIVNSE